MNDQRKPAPDLATVHAFLLGEGPLDGFHFGGSNTADPRPRYWWRAQLREAIAAAPAPQRFDRVTPQPDGSFQHSYRGQPVPGPRAAVPDVVARSLLRQAELFEQLFGLHDVLDVAYVADNLRVAAGLKPIHDGPTSERAAALEQRRTLAEQLLQAVERVANAGKVARVQLLDGVPLVVPEEGE